MKQSFTLKVVALGFVALATFGASAARPELVRRADGALKGSVQLKAKASVVRTAVATGVAEAYSTMVSHRFTPAYHELDLTQNVVSRAINPYGAWEDAGTLTYTFSNLFDGQNVSKTYNYQKRVNRNNENNFQIKVAGWGGFTAEEVGEVIPGCELVLTVTPGLDPETKEPVYTVTTSNAETLANEGIAVGWQAQGPESVGAIDMYFYDHYTYAQTVAQYNPNMTPDAVASWFASSTYDPRTGKMEIMPIYAGTGELSVYALPYGERNASGAYVKYWYDYVQLSGEFVNYDFGLDTAAAYFYRNAGETSGHYKLKYVLNDNVLGVVKIIPGQLEQQAIQGAFNEMVAALNEPTADMAVFTDREGWVDLEVQEYVDGYYTLLYGVAQEAGADGQMNIKGGYYEVVNDGAEFVLDGFAKYNDVIIPGFLSLLSVDNQVVTPEMVGLPTTYTTTCQVEKSDRTPGLYRLRAPYAEYPGDALFDYSQSMDYLYYNIANPTQAYVEFGLTGHRLSLQDGDVYVAYGSANQCFDDVQQTIYATYADNKLTFPATTYNQDFEFVDAKGQPFTRSIKMAGILALMVVPGTNSAGQAVINFYDWSAPADPSQFLIETGATDAIDNVEAAVDANAPVEYYNLQGQKVVNPAAGQLVIKKQGGKVTKVIAQ